MANVELPPQNTLRLNANVDHQASPGDQVSKMRFENEGVNLTIKLS
jgi:hypothetical protein